MVCGILGFGSLVVLYGECDLVGVISYFDFGWVLGGCYLGVIWVLFGWWVWFGWVIFGVVICFGV